MDLARAQEAVAEEYGFALHRSYDEKTAARLVGADYSTLKRWRRTGQVPFVRRGSGVRYMGFQLADMLLQGTQPHAVDLSKAGAREVKLSVGSNDVAANRLVDDRSKDLSDLARSILLRRQRKT